MRYSLANYIVSIKPSDSTLIETFGETISVGGKGSTLGSISINRDKKMFSMKSYATGGYVLEKDLSKCGSVSLQLNQLAPEVQKFINLCNSYYGGDYSGCTITVTGINGKNVVSAIDCFINQTNQSYSETSENQTWEFVAGEVNFEVQA